MVQVDVFWTYGLGAGFAIAASTQLVKEKQEHGGSWFRNPYLTATLMFLGVLFAPSGICLLWAFPSWETMHVGDRNLPAWLVTLFAATNITQGVLGFGVTYALIQRGKRYLASLQMLLGYFLLFFILVHGWDGTGYRRFFSATKADFLSWKLSNIPAWFVSDVALTLIIFGVLMVPLLLLMMSAWILEGARQGDAASGGTPEATRGQVAGRILKMIFVGALGLAIAASLLVRLAGWIFGAAWGWALGLLVFFAAAYLLALRRGAYLHRLAGQMLCSREPLP